MMSNKENTSTGRLSWLVRLGFGCGDFAQNLIYQTVSIYLLFFYTDIFGLSPATAATMFLVVRLVDVLWDPFVGAYVDKHNPRWGKYRSYLLLAGLPLTVLAILCFWNPFGATGGHLAKTIYAYVTYVGLSLLYTLVNVPYGALNASLSRDTDEVTILTSVRMVMANVGSLAVSAGVPILVAVLATDAVVPWKMALFMGIGPLPAFIFLPLVPAIKKAVGKKNMFYLFLGIAIFGMALLYVISRVGRIENHLGWVYVAQFVKSTGVIVATGYMWALIPEVVTYAEHQTGKRISGIVSALTGIFYKAGMALGGVVPGLVLAGTDYQVAAAEKSTLPTAPGAWFTAMLIFALVGFVFLVFCFTQTRERVVMDAAQTDKVKISDLWMEFRRNRPLRIVALFFVTAFAMMSVGNAAGAYFMNGLENQTPLAQEGIRWLVCVIPAILLGVAMAIIARYPLTDELVAKINREIEEGKGTVQ